MQTTFHRWLNKPPLGYGLDPDNPYGRFAGAWLLNEGGGGVFGNLANPADVGTVSAAWAAGKDGSALSFNGSSQYAVSSYNVGTNVAVTNVSGPVSVAVWIKLTATGSFGYVLGSVASFKGLRVTSGTTISLADGSIDITGGSLGTGTWTHVVGTLDGTNGTIYVNGVQAGRQATAVTGWAGMVLGARASSGTQASYQACVVDHTLLLPYALTAAQVAALYDDPFGMVLAPTYRRWFTPAAGGVTAPVGKALTVGQSVMNAVSF